MRRLAFALAFTIVCGCMGHDHDELVSTGASCEATSSLTYDSFGSAFFASYCTSCHSTTRHGRDRHGAPSEHNFDSIDLIRDQAIEIDGSAAAGPLAANKLMPITYQAPTMDERIALGVWLACGAP